MKRKILKILFRAIPFVCIAVVFLLLLLLPTGREQDVEKRVVRVWNVDTFEGGKGSRTSFLKKVALKAEKQGDGVYYMVASYTVEGAIEAFRTGDKPDILSFGVGLSEFAEQAIPLEESFIGGEIASKCYAYPWCRGGYALFSLTDDFEESGDVAISVGGSNLPAVAAALCGIEGKETDSQAAYTGFLSGKYRYLLGTQRDLYRFESRNKTVYYRALTEYCDLYQYVSVLSDSKKADCKLFLDTLFSNEIQSSLTEIGMFSLGESNDFVKENLYTVSVFTSSSALQTLSEAARKGEEIKNLEKFLKNI